MEIWGWEGTQEQVERSFQQRKGPEVRMHLGQAQWLEGREGA